jgi:ABC-2 type transport system ATP-binding protein
VTESPVHVQGLERRYGRKEVLRGVDLDVPAGSVVGLLGRNGEGKTTLLKCLLGLLRPDGGTARVLGRDPWDLDADTKARIGYVPQEVELYG